MHEKIETTRKLIDAAITAGRCFQSSQTGLIHYYHSHHAELIHQTIPTYDNAVFVLALFRSRVVENIREAQNLLGRLLAFQTEEGNFPFYLHEYPLSKNFSLAIQLMAPFYWILKLFGHVLGKDLRISLELCIKRLVSYVLHAAQIKQFNFSMTARLTAGLLAFGRQLNVNEWQETGKHLLEELKADTAIENWSDTSHIADILIALSMAKGEFQAPIWDRFMQFITQTWHIGLATYCGPCISEHQNQLYPAGNLYELYMGCLTGRLENRMILPTIELLQGSLIQPINHIFEEAKVQMEEFGGSYQEATWLCHPSQNFALTLLEKHPALDERIHKTYTPFRLIWGNSSHPHSLVCQGGNAKSIAYKWKKPVIELIFELDDFKENSNDSSREICFYVDIYPELLIGIGQLRTTVFEFKQVIQMKLNEEQELTMTFELLEGEGNFLGHIAQSNRPSQLKQTEAKKLQVFDWMIFLRTLRRSDHCKIKVTLSLGS